MIKARFSKNYWAIRKRIQRMPKLFEKTADTITKKDADGFIETYKEGIRNNSFGLTPLKSVSRQQKMKKGYSKPNTPLYGAGDSRKNSYINALRRRKIKKGYRVFISHAKHHEANLPLSVLFEIHEKGVLIRVTPRMRAFLHTIDMHLRADTTIIRIPPRPTRGKAFKRFLAKRLRQENTEKARESIINFLRTGNYKGIK